MAKETEYVNGGINKNTYKLLFEDSVVDASERQNIEKIKTWTVIQEFTMEKQKEKFCNELNFAHTINPNNFGILTFDNETKKYKYTHNDIEYTFDILSNYINDPELRKELLSNERYGKCNNRSIILANTIKGSKLATGYITIGANKVLHTVVLATRNLDNVLLVYDWTENLIMPFEQYKDMVGFNVITIIDASKVEPDFEKLEGIGIDTKSYLVFRNELMHDLEETERKLGGKHE